ncbi:MAG: hypothetical protein BECKG1743F_GA0114225_108462 [Candidatus Kentron sp. G]|nr:MAG: hypothetical protein BECKG1743F_GA0114225_108462 [Candidatus Kentron sp. G]
MISDAARAGDTVRKLVIRLYRKCSGRFFRSIGCGPPRWISNNDYYRKSSGVDRIRLI